MMTPAPPLDLELERGILRAALGGPPERVVLMEGGRAFHLGELRASSLRAAEILRRARASSAGGGSFPPAGIAVRSGFSLAAALLGAWEARCAPILIDPSSRGEIDHLLDIHPGMRCLVAADGPPRRGGLSMPALPASAPETGAAPLEGWPAVPAADEPCVSFFTSGSEGVPKLVPKTARQVLAHAAAASRMLGLPSGCRSLCFVPLFHILGFAYGFLAPLRAGGVSMLSTEPLPALLRKALLELRPDLVVATAVQYRFLSSVLRAEDELPDAVYISSGAPLSPRDRSAFVELTGREITELYGSTETAGIAWRRGDAPWTPYPGAEVRIEDDRIRVRSPWAHPEDPALFVETHDIAEPDGGGFRLLGRAGTIVKVGGKRFSSLEVEEILRGHPRVADAAVVPFERGGEPALAAFIAAVEGEAVDEPELRRYLAERLAPFKVPRAIRFLASLPRAKLNKLDYAELIRLARGEPR